MNMMGKLLHDEANAETRKVHIISDERQRHIITKGNKKKTQNNMFCVSKIHKHFRKNTSADIQLVRKHSLGSAEIFLVSNSIFIISKDLIFNIGYQTSFQEDQQKNSNLLLQKRIRKKR